METQEFLKRRDHYSMDFSARLQLRDLLSPRKLSALQASIQRAASWMLNAEAASRPDLAACLIDELKDAPPVHRINLLLVIDTVLRTATEDSTLNNASKEYLELWKPDIHDIVHLVTAADESNYVTLRHVYINSQVDSNHCNLLDFLRMDKTSDVSLRDID